MLFDIRGELFQIDFARPTLAGCLRLKRLRPARQTRDTNAKPNRGLGKRKAFFFTHRQNMAAEFQWICHRSNIIKLKSLGYIPQKDGAIYSPDKAMFEVLAPHFGLEPSDYGHTFRSKDELFRIAAINPNRPKYPISAERVSDGRGFKFPADNVVMYLQRSGP